MLARAEMGESCTTLDGSAAVETAAPDRAGDHANRPMSGWCAADVVFVGRIKATWAVFADQLLEIAETQWSRSWVCRGF